MFHIAFKRSAKKERPAREGVPFLYSPLVRLTGIEPVHTASEAAALSAELQAHISRFMTAHKKINNNPDNITIYYYTKSY